MIKAGNTSYSVVRSFYDKDSDSDILVYGTSDKADWAAYMSADTKKSRVDWVSGLNFGGITDWAVDNRAKTDPSDKCDPKERKYSSIGVVTNGDHHFDQLSAELYTLAIGLNLFTISENCLINPRRPPLHPRLDRAGKSPAQTLHAAQNPAFEP
ncbi:hypothetical protein QBC33DRAFT_560777 [Phialemonium atrogriseum]|uniref:Chitinase n=1 Tax=Phialemonium atrogriseum TaxID=1093897 RepID=A0AAJ0C0G5_9PEZI|nr:uncharacterized protein QBC33DRAFT_560777 [Phialemonium atrogriseum]KAK1765411.1 hypothetical protein QBC33DRAFT_560777 [Phialemonium atrogriseum]